MRIAEFSTADGPYGAGLAALSLHKALRGAGADAQLAVWKKTSIAEGVQGVFGSGIGAKLRYAANSVLKSAFIHFWRPEGFFNEDFLTAPKSKMLAFARGADIIQVNWVTGLLSTRLLSELGRASGAPVVWTLMDHAPLTGGCHYPGLCRRFEQSCGCCPAIHSKRQLDLTALTLSRKRRLLPKLKMAVVACSSQDAALVRRSAAFEKAKLAEIPVAVDADIFRSVNPSAARELLQVPLNSKVVFFGASSLAEKRKGFRFLIDALSLFAADHPELAKGVSLLVAGREFPPELRQLNFQTRYLGVFGDQRSLALAYQAADLFVSPSIDDSGPMMVLEALLCGTPIVAFPIGYARDLVRDGALGELAALAESRSLAASMARVLSLDGTSVAHLRERCRRVAFEFCAAQKVAEKYLALYRELLQDSR